MTDTHIHGAPPPQNQVLHLKLLEPQQMSDVSQSSQIGGVNCQSKTAPDRVPIYESQETLSTATDGAHLQQHRGVSLALMDFGKSFPARAELNVFYCNKLQMQDVVIQ